MVNLDVLAIGAGTAGGLAACAAEGSVDPVGLVERGRVGGDCIFHACIPTEALPHGFAGHPYGVGGAVARERREGRVGDLFRQAT